MNFRCKMWPLQPAVEPQRSTYTIWIPHATESKKGILSFHAFSSLTFSEQLGWNTQRSFAKKKKLHLIRFKNNSFQVQDAQCNLAPRRPSEEIQRKIQRSSNRPVKGSKMIQKIQAKSSHLSTHTKSWQIGRLTTLQSCGNGCDAHQVR